MWSLGETGRSTLHRSSHVLPKQCNLHQCIHAWPLGTHPTKAMWHKPQDSANVVELCTGSQASLAKGRSTLYCFSRTATSWE